MKLTVLDGAYQIAKLKISDEIPSDVFNQEFCSFTRTDEEISLVVDCKVNMKNVVVEKPWKIIKIKGVLDFSLIGILAKVSKILANNGISIFVVSTYNTDYILVKASNLGRAVEVLTDNDYYFE